MGAGLNDAIGSRYFNIGQTSDFDYESSFNIGDKYGTLFESLHKPLHENCKDFSVLGTTIKLMNMNVLNKLTDKAFDNILKKKIREVLPEGNHCTENYKHTRTFFVKWAWGMSKLTFINKITFSSMVSMQVPLYVQYASIVVMFRIEFHINELDGSISRIN